MKSAIKTPVHDGYRSGSSASQVSDSTHVPVSPAPCMRTEQELASSCSKILSLIGENPAREGLLKTPERFAKSIRELTRGYEQDILSVVNGALFEEKCTEAVYIKDIEFYSLCEHHLLPFYGSVSIAYIPSGKVLGLSKFPRIVDMFARRLQIQERLTQEISDQLTAILQPKGLGCFISAQHLCMKMRGIQSQSSRLETQALRGSFKENTELRQEFLQRVRSTAPLNTSSPL